jgi:hypothetical protein
MRRSGLVRSRDHKLRAELPRAFAGSSIGVLAGRHEALFESPSHCGLARAMTRIAQWTIDAARSVAFEAAVTKNGHGVCGKTDYSETCKQRRQRNGLILEPEFHSSVGVINNHE